MSTTMLYKAPGPHEIHGGQMDYTIVEDDQIEAALAEGWHLTTPEAKQAHQAKLEAEQAVQAERARQAADVTGKVPADTNTPPTRAELEQMATKLKLAFNSRTTDRKLAEMIKAATEPSDTPEAKQAHQDKPPADADTDEQV
jgi:hypothetical protein